MSHPRKLFLSAALAVCGITYAAAPAWQGMTQAGPHHERVLKGVGQWVGTLTMHSPEMPEPMSSECSEDVAAIGDLWTTSRFQTNFMGMPFVGASTLGYDVQKGKYVGTWIDSMNSALTVMEGSYDEAKKAIVMNYMMAEPGGELQKMRSETVTSANAYTIKFFQIDGTEATLQMEMQMTRKSGAREASATK